MLDQSLIPEEIKALLNKAPIKFELLDGHSYSDKANLKSVKSPNIFAVNSNQFHPNGLFSEEIFGSITNMDRFVTEAVIPLNTSIIHPVIFAFNIKPKTLYMNILSGKQYGVFDESINNFILAKKDDPNSGTGFQFFVKHLSKLGDIETESLRAINKAKLISKNKDKLMTTHLICIPAGLRDLDMKSSRLSNEDINKLYMAVINLTSSLSSFHMSDDSIFDGIRYQIQLKVSAVFDYIMNVISEKGGFIQKHYGARKIAYSTRNVISAATNDSDSVEDPTVIKSNETMVPMLNLIKCFQPFFIHYVKNKLYGEIFRHGSTESVAVTNSKTLEMEYTSLKPIEISKYTTSEGVNKIINQFKYIGFRESAISITDKNGKEYYLILTYNIQDQVFIGKTKTDLQRVVESFKLKFDQSLIKPMTWVEFLYIAALNIAKDKNGFITRYPVLEDGSIYPGVIHITTTNPSEQKELVFDSGLKINTPHYPVIGKPYFESLILHQSRLPGLSADHDGDTVSLSTLWTKEGNDDVRNSLNDISSVIGSNMKLKMSTDSDILNLAIHNLSRQDLVDDFVD
jgi:hypothetical protein